MLEAVADLVCNGEVQHLVGSDYDECNGHDVVGVVVAADVVSRLNFLQKGYCTVSYQNYFFRKAQK